MKGCCKMNSGLNTLYERRSIRKYKPEQISDEELELVLKAGTCAPTAMNLQSPIIIAVQNKEEIAYISKLNAKIMGQEGIDPFYGAPTLLIVLADAASKNATKDGSLVMGNLMNAAHAVGLGSCWINRATELFDMQEGKELLKKWGIEGEYIGVGNCILGYADQELPAMKPRKDNYVYYIR